MRPIFSVPKKILLASASLRRAVQIGLVGALLGQTSSAFGQTQMPANWSVRDLSPPGAWSYLHTVGENILMGGVWWVVDWESGPMGPVVDGHAGYWQSAIGPFVEFDLNGKRWAHVSDASGDLLVGEFMPPGYSDGHAALWTTPLSPPIDVNPEGYMVSRIRATNGRQHVGFANIDPYASGSGSIPMLWTGASAAAVVLPLPPGAKGGSASAISAAQQGGSVDFGNIGDVFQYSAISHAVLWNGAKGRVVDLHPSGATASLVAAMTDVYQAGEVNYSTSLDRHQAALWFGSPESVTILAAPGSSVHGASGPYQVGMATVDGQPHAMLWRSSASSAIDLHALLPAGFVSSSANLIWTDGTKILIGGSANRPDEYGSHAILWAYPPSIPLSFTRTPQSITVAEGSSFALNASATGSGTISFQWQRDGAEIIGATTASLVASQPGTYRVTVRNGTESITSPPAVVSQIVTSDIGRLTNLSTRATVSTEGDALILGVVISGAHPKPILARAAGPALSAYGLSGLLADPVLTIMEGGAVVAANDNWNGGPISNANATVGAFPFTLGSRDAAIAMSVSPGAYTFHVTGKNGATGLVLAELYDATSAAEFTPDSPRFVNVSVRTRITQDAPIVIAGFVIAGATAQTVLIRAIGQGLASLGVRDALSDPKLQLFSHFTLLFENDDWSEITWLAAAGGSIGATPVPGSSRKDATLVVTLPPGSYTAQVSGVENATGTVLVEVYEVR